jgi:hypothetical protein
VRRVRFRTVLLVVCVAGMSLVPGRAPATIEEQRARLPPPAECRDPVAGVWQSHSYNEMYGEWGRFTLAIRRVDGSESELEGTILNESWYGPKTEVVRGPCRGPLQYLVSMDARGTVVSGEIHFGGVGEWRLDTQFCGDLGGYNLDNFSGQIDPQLLEFQSVNNDGGRYVNVPTVFRRVGCSEDEFSVTPKVAVTPPPFFPPRDENGCGWTG